VRAPYDCIDRNRHVWCGRPAWCAKVRENTFRNLHVAAFESRLWPNVPDGNMHEPMTELPTKDECPMCGGRLAKVGPGLWSCDDCFEPIGDEPNDANESSQ
jgi:hypothetical protein